MARELAIELVVLAGALVPREECRSRDSARRPLIGLSQDVEDSAGHGCRRHGVEVASGVAADLGECSRVRGGDRAAASHRLDRGLTEALVQTRKDEGRCASIELEQVVRRHVAANDHTRRHGPPVVPGSREDEREIRPLATYEREGLEQALVVLVGPAVGRVEEERLSFALVGAEARPVDAEVDDANAFGSTPRRSTIVSFTCALIAMISRLARTLRR